MRKSVIINIGPKLRIHGAVVHYLLLKILRLFRCISWSTRVRGSKIAPHLVDANHILFAEDILCRMPDIEKDVIINLLLQCICRHVPDNPVDVLGKVTDAHCLL